MRDGDGRGLGKRSTTTGSAYGGTVHGQNHTRVERKKRRKSHPAEAQERRCSARWRMWWQLTAVDAQLELPRRELLVHRAQVRATGELRTRACRPCGRCQLRGIRPHMGVRVWHVWAVSCGAGRCRAKSVGAAVSGLRRRRGYPFGSRRRGHAPSRVATRPSNLEKIISKSDLQ